MKTRIKALLLALLSAAALSQTASSIGISPGIIVFNNMPRGGYAERTLMLSSAGDKDLLITPELQGQAAAWLTIQPSITNATLAGRGGQLPFKLKLKLHPSVGTGLYNATLIISTASVEAVKMGVSGASFMPGVIVPILVNVTGEESVEYDLKNFAVSDTEKDDMIEYSFTIENKGNVEVTPNITAEILNADKSRVFATEQINAKAVLPSTEENMAFETSSEGLKLGRYWLRLTAVLRGAAYLKREVDFKIVEVGAISTSGFLSDLIIPSRAAAGEKIKITAYFNNTSDKVFDLQSFCEVFTAGKFLDTVESKQVRAGSEAVTEVVSYYTVPSASSYQVKCYANYQNKQSNTIEKTVDAGAGESNGGATSYIIYALIGLMALVMAYVVYSRFIRK
jgi:hypothetical protein